MRIRPRSRLPMHTGNELNRWTVSLADFMTLMFAVFVVLYAVSSSKEEKYKDVIQSIQDASKLLQPAAVKVEDQQLTDSNSAAKEVNKAQVLSANRKMPSETDKFSRQGINQADNALSEVDAFKTGKTLSELQSQLQKVLTAELKNELIELDLDGDWLTIEMGGSLLFIGGSHTLLNSAKEQIKKLAQILRPVNNMLRIRGYTDQEAISNEIYFSNWELAGARALSVLHELNALGIAGKRMVMEAYGQYNPVIDRQGHIDKVRSRRVVIAISKYALLDEKPLSAQEKPANTDKKESRSGVPASKPDREEMHEIHLPDNRLIITTRQE